MGEGGKQSVRKEIRALTGLRAFAAAWVVVYHYWALTPSGHWMSTLEPVRPLIESGWLGVDLFFILSGFVMTHTYVESMGRRPSVRASATYLWNRLSRVWPLWVFVLVSFTGWLVFKHLVFGGEHLHEGVQPSITPLTMLEQLAMVQVWTSPVHWGTGQVGPGWSLSAEWLAYCAFPLLVLVLYRLRRWPAVVLGAGAVLAMLPFTVVVVVQGHGNFDYSWLVRIAAGFFAGALVALCLRRLDAGPRLRRAASVVSGATIGALLVVVWWADLGEGEYVGVAVILFPVLVGSLALAETGPARWLGRDWVVMGGRISFALYLVHICLFEVFWTLMDVVPALGPASRWSALASPVVLAATIPVSYLLWRFVEEPARRALRGREPWARRPVAPPAVPSAPVRPSPLTEATVSLALRNRHSSDALARPRVPVVVDEQVPETAGSR